MKSAKLILVLSACSLLVAGTTALAQETNDSHLLEITKVGVKIGHETAFRDAVKAYNACLLEHEDAGTWSAWSNVGGKGREYHIVTTMENWAEKDSPWEPGKACWPDHHDQLTENLESVAVTFARKLPDWSVDAEGYSVVRLHQFRVKDDQAFRESVGSIVDILKESGYPHLGTWYNVIGNDASEPGYFVAAPFENFAAMDEDAGPYQALIEAAGQERAEQLWEQFGESLRDDSEYSSALLRREDDLSHTNDSRSNDD